MDADQNLVRNCISNALEYEVLTIEELTRMVEEEKLAYILKKQERCTHNGSIEEQLSGYYYKQCMICKKFL